MIARTLQKFVHCNLMIQWKNLPALYHGHNITRNSETFKQPRDFQSVPLLTTIKPTRTTQIRGVNVKFFELQKPYFSCRSFSTSSSRNSVSKKLENYYKKKDLYKLKRKEFFKKFSAARFVNAAPDSWKPYLELARVDKPIGTWLLYLPCAFSICMATPPGSLPDFYYLGLFGVGAFLMRGAGCVINDLWDQDLDKHVERTKSRPLASGKIKTRNAIALLAVQLSLSLGILLSLNTTCILIGVAAMIPVIFYPLAKRVTYFPQAVLGVTFNIGAIMGYAAVGGHIDWLSVLPLYMGCFMWTMYYDTVYAVQDADDDIKVGIKSTALLFLASRNVEELRKMPVGERLYEMNQSRKNLQWGLAATYGSTMILWLIAFVNADLGMIAYLTPALHVFRVLPSEHVLRSRSDCWERFVESKNLGLLVLLGIILGAYFQPPKKEEKQ